MVRRQRVSAAQPPAPAFFTPSLGRQRPAGQRDKLPQPLARGAVCRNCPVPGARGEAWGHAGACGGGRGVGRSGSKPNAMGGCVRGSKERRGALTHDGCAMGRAASSRCRWGHDYWRATAATLSERRAAPHPRRSETNFKQRTNPTGQILSTRGVLCAVAPKSGARLRARVPPSDDP